MFCIQDTPNWYLIFGITEEEKMPKFAQAYQKVMRIYKNLLICFLCAKPLLKYVSITTTLERNVYMAAKLCSQEIMHIFPNDNAFFSKKLYFSHNKNNILFFSHNSNTYYTIL